MDDNDQILFDKFLARNWGISTQKLGATATEGKAIAEAEAQVRATQQPVQNGNGQAGPVNPILNQTQRPAPEV